MTIGKKVMLCFGAILAVNFVLGYNSLSVARSLGADLDRAVNSTGKAMEQIGRLTTALSDMKASEAGFILFSSLNDSDQVQNTQRNFHDAARRMQSAVQEARHVLGAGAAHESLDTLDRGQVSLTVYFQDMVQLCAAQKCNQALLLHTQQALPLGERMSLSASRFAAAQRAKLQETASGAEAKSAQTYWVSCLLIGVSDIVGIALFFALRRMNRLLRGFASRMALTAQQVSTAATQVSGSSGELADGAFKQATALEETSATTEALAVMTKRNADSTRAAFELVLEGEQRVGAANRTLKQMESSMKEINGSSDKISKIIKVIEEIAFQTSILALNAAVEAARAGEAGLGFAVVADEVRNLAQRCSQAAKDTASLIEESIERSSEGSSNLDRVAGAIDGITEASRKIRRLVDEVNLAGQEQAKGIEHVSQAVARISQVTQRSAGNAEAGAAAGKQMAAQAEQMNTMVCELRAMVGSET